MSDKTIFEKIIDKELPADIVYENERIIAFNDIHPVAPLHILICPKKPIASLQEVMEADWPVVVEALQVAQQLAARFGIENGYRLLTNNGSTAGQTIYHLHFHLIGGRLLGALA